jgi:hypothetical protein
MKTQVPLEVRQAAMRQRQYCTSCGKHLFKGCGVCKCPPRGRPRRGRPKELKVAELLKIIRRSMKEW